MNDAMYMALQSMIEQCNNSQQRNALYAAMDMLCDFWDDKWYSSSDEENKAFVRSYMISNFLI